MTNFRYPRLSFLQKESSAQRLPSAARTNRCQIQALHERQANCASAARLCYPAPHCTGFSIPHAGTRKRGALRIIQEQMYQACSAPRAIPNIQVSRWLYCFSNSGTRDNAGLQRRARTAASDKPCMRDMLIARRLHALVGWPVRRNPRNVIFFLSKKPRKPRCAERDCDAIDSSYLVKEICEATQRLSSGGRTSRDNLRE